MNTLRKEENIMRNFFSIILCLAMLPALHVSAAADPMEAALGSVKEHIEIPAELTEFESRTLKDDNNNITYDFNWSDKEGKMIEIQCDKYGRISSYWSWDNSEHDAETHLSPYTKADALEYAENFLKHVMPDVFSDISCLELDNDGGIGSMDSYGTSYTFNFIRKYEGVEVLSNNTSVTVIASENGLTVRRMFSDYDYDTEFITPEKELENPEQAYRSAFPIKLHYEKDYEKSDATDIDVTKLVYSVEESGTGFISAENGEIKKEKLYAEPYPVNELAMDAAAGDSSFSRKESFTEVELAELNNVAGLKSEQEIEKIFRNISDLKMTSEMKLKNSQIYKYDDKYIMNLYFSDDKDRSLHVSADAKTGEIKSINNYNNNDYDRDYEISETQTSETEKKAKNFLKLAAPDIAAEYELDTLNSSSSTASLYYVRMVNGVDYSVNFANISYNVKTGMLTNYYINYSDASFDNPENAVDGDTAYDNLLSKYPLKKIYVLTDSDMFELCYTPSKGYMNIDAISGEVIETSEPEGEYTDIKGHWCENAVTRLAEVGIRLSGSEFKPDEEITKSDLLKLFGAGLEGTGYLYYKNSDIASSMLRMKVIKKDEPVDESPVTREDACVYMVRLAGFERVAKLTDIFKVSFSDSADISPEKIGYAAILSGMGIVAGDNGALLPKQNITRAEAAQMLYVYLLSD